MCLIEFRFHLNSGDSLEHEQARQFPLRFLHTFHPLELEGL